MAMVRPGWLGRNDVSKIGVILDMLVLFEKIGGSGLGQSFTKKLEHVRMQGCWVKDFSGRFDGDLE